MVSTLDVIRSALVDLLIIGAILVVALVLVIAWRASRRLQLVVAELINSTGHSDLDGVTRGLTQLTRQRIDAELRVVSERRDYLVGLLRSTAHHGINHTDSGGRTNQALEPVQKQFDNRMQELLTATREVAPKQTQPTVQLLTLLVSRPRGLMVSGILQCRGTAGPRWGVSFDVLRVDTNRSVASHTFWEPATSAASDSTEQADLVSQPADAGTTHERILTLLLPAGRWLAVELVIRSVFPDGEQEGLDRLLSGMLYSQSTGKGFEGFEDDFRQLALADLRDAAAALDEVKAPSHKVKAPNPMRLAALADTLTKLAPFARDATAKAETYQKAHTLYDHTLKAMEASGAYADAVKRYRVRRAISWLASELPEPRLEALHWLDEGEQALPKPSAANDLYDAACLYALAARDRSHRHLRTNAARLLIQALALSADQRGGKLWEEAKSDRQLTGVPVAALEAALITNAQPAAQLPHDKLDSIADQVLSSTGTPNP